MTLWTCLLVVFALAVSFHWMAANRDRSDVRRLRTLYWGDPLLGAITLDVICVLIVVMIVLRVVGYDVPAFFAE
jgi:hypothetical protein